MEARQAHSYVSLPDKLANIIDTIVSTVYFGGDKKYQDRKDFVIKSIQTLVDQETKRNPSLKEKLLSSNNLQSNEIVVRRRGNRIHDTKFRIK